MIPMQLLAKISSLQDSKLKTCLHFWWTLGRTLKILEPWAAEDSEGHTRDNLLQSGAIWEKTINPVLDTDTLRGKKTNISLYVAKTGVGVKAVGLQSIILDISNTKVHQLKDEPLENPIAEMV